MKKYLISFATPDFYASQERLNNSARKYVDEIISYNKDWLMKKEFYKKNKKILDQKRGAGYWLWKPYIVLETLKKMKEGDVLFYIDSGIEVVGDITELIPALVKEKKDIFLFKNDEIVLNKTYTKRDCFILMGCDSKKYYEADQVIAGFNIYIKSKKSIKFVEEWIKYGEDERAITDINNTLGKPNIEGFVEHRWDQSILSILAKRENFILHTKNRKYINVHRTRERKGLELIKYKIKLMIPVSLKNKIKSLMYK